MAILGSMFLVEVVVAAAVASYLTFFLSVGLLEVAVAEWKEIGVGAEVAEEEAEKDHLIAFHLSVCLILSVLEENLFVGSSFLKLCFQPPIVIWTVQRSYQ